MPHDKPQKVMGSLLAFLVMFIFYYALSLCVYMPLQALIHSLDGNHGANYASARTIVIAGFVSGTVAAIFSAMMLRHLFKMPYDGFRVWMGFTITLAIFTIFDGLNNPYFTIAMLVQPLAAAYYSYMGLVKH